MEQERWIVDPSPELPVAVIEDTEDGEGVCEVGPHLMFAKDRRSENMRRARLIAAAPKMLKGHERIETEAAWEDETTIEQLRRKLDNCSEEAQAAIAAATE